MKHRLPFLATLLLAPLAALAQDDEPRNLKKPFGGRGLTRAS
jgi:hypothetical protein